MTEESRKPLPPVGLIVAALLLHLLPFVSRPALIGGDEAHYALAAHSLGTDHDLDLTDEYSAVSEGAHAAGRKLAGQDLDRHLVWVNGREVFAHPIGLPVLAAPLIGTWQTISPNAAPDWLLGLLSLTVTFVGLAAGWQLLRDHAGSGPVASWLVFCVYFSSPLWFYSRTFFTEPYTWAFAVLAISALTRRRLFLAGLFLALTLAMKEMALLLVIPILLGSLALQGVGTAAAVAVGPGLFMLAFMVKNLLLTGRPLSTFQPFEYGDFGSGAWGLLFDSGRGLFWFAPLLAVAMSGWLLRSLNRQQAVLSRCCLVAFIGYFALTAAWIDWRGGSSYGTRLLLPALPALAVPLLGLSRALPQRLSIVLLGGLATLGFSINFCAAVDPFPVFWGLSVTGVVASQPLAFFGIAALTAAALLRFKSLSFTPTISGPVSGHPESRPKVSRTD